jgi:hypothetical protein
MFGFYTLGFSVHDLDKQSEIGCFPLHYEHIKGETKLNYNVTFALDFIFQELKEK